MSDEIKNRYFGRRQFLMGVGGHFLLLPLMTSMLPRALAQAVQPQKRLAMFPQTLGLHNAYLHPDPTAIASMMRTYAPGITYAPLSGMAKPISYMIDTSYNDLLSQMNILAGLDFMEQNSHTYGIFAGCGPAVPDGHNNRIPIVGKTIDVIVEQSPAFQASFKGQLPTLRLSADLTQYHVTDATMAYDRAADGTALPQPFLRGDTNVFNRLFSTTLPVSGTPTAVRKKMVADSVLEDLNRLKNHRRISSADKLMLDRYIAGIDDVQRKLMIAAPACSAPSIAYQVQANGAVIANGSPQKFYDNIWDMATLAFACDQSRMLMIMNSLGADNFDVHYLHHEGDDIEHQGTDRQNWYVQQIAKFARKLAAFPDPSGSGSLLDNSLLMVIQEHGGKIEHSATNLPILTFGKLGGSVRTGNFVQYVSNVTRNQYGYPMKRMLITALEAMGVQKTQYIKEGDTYGFGHWGDWGDQYYANMKAAANDPLPFFTAGT